MASGEVFWSRNPLRYFLHALHGNVALLTHAMKGKRILITGGAGSIGSELVRQLYKRNKIYILDINESGIFDLTDELDSKNVTGRVGDIRDYATVKDVFDDFKPQIVFNAAAYKHVPLMEYTPLEAIQTNVIGHHNLVHTARTWECVEKFIFVSTDKVVSSRSIMGATKRLSEVVTLNQGKGYIVVRFGNVLDSRGSLLSIWRRQHRAGQPLTITDARMERYFMSIPDAARLVIEAARMGNGGEIFIMDMGEKKNILKLKKELYPKYPHKIIDIRPGETLTEDLMFEEEKRRASKIGNFYVIR